MYGVEKRPLQELPFDACWVIIATMILDVCIHLHIVYILCHTFIHSFIFHFLRKQHMVKDQENLTEVEKVVGVSKKQACQVETPIKLQ